MSSCWINLGFYVANIFCGLGTLISITLACMEATGVSRLQTCVGRWRSAPTRVRWAALDGPFCDADMPRIPNEPEGCGSHNPKVVAVTVRRLWHHSPKAVEATTRRSWRPQPGGCGSHSPNTVAPQPEGCGSHDPKIVAATTRRLWQPQPGGCGRIDRYRRAASHILYTPCEGVTDVDR